MDLKEFRKKAIEEHGIKWYWWEFTHSLEDVFLERTKVKDLWWWITDGKPYWPDAVPCNRVLCRHCGRKPFKHENSK